MISFYSETNFQLKKEKNIKEWVFEIISSEGFMEGEISFIFCSDSYLHKINLEFLKHDTFTDIISFNYSLGKQINGEVYISVDRVLNNADEFSIPFEEELHRVIIHGILHFCGYNDKTLKEKEIMRKKENQSLLLLSS